MDDINTTRRAFKAHFRRHGPSADRPSSRSGVEAASNVRHYVVFRGGRNSNGICSVYRVGPDEKLKHLKRWPVELG